MLRHASLLLVLTSCLGALPALADEFVIRPGQDKNLVVFQSRATLETFEGKTRQVSGSLSLDPANLGDSITVHLEVDLASLDTGIPLRNKHMRENHLDTSKYPKAVFDGARILEASSRALEPTKALKVRIAGRFDLHGVSREIEVPVEVVRAADGTLRVTTRFDVALADYRIDRPGFLMLKLEEIQHVTVQVTAHPRP